jgi:uncharacterized protein with HEPN domain
LPEEIKSGYSRVEWAKIVAFRNILIHEYSGTKLRSLWTAIQDKIQFSRKQQQQSTVKGLELRQGYH